MNFAAHLKESALTVESHIETGRLSLPALDCG
jgi:hypothetical protein